MEQLRFWFFVLAIFGGLQTAVADPLGVEPSPPDSAQALESNGRYSDARDLYLSMIDQFDADNDAFNPDLIEPLIGLGRTREKLGDYPGAKEALRRAQHIVHRSEGVHSLRQIEIIDLLTDLELAAEEPLDADVQQHFALYIGQRNFGRDSPDLIPFEIRLANWYTDSGQFYKATKTLDDTIELVIQDGGENDPRLIEPLIQSAKIRRLSGSCCSYRVLKTAEEVVLASPDLPNDSKVAVYEALGDAYLVDNKEEEAAEAYAKVWELLGDEAASRKYSAPANIALSRDLHRASIARKRIYTVDQYQLDFTSGLIQPVSDRDRYMLENLPPQRFFVPLQTNNRNFHILDTYTQNDSLEPAQKVIGRPFQFFENQLHEILPLGMHGESEIAQLFLEFHLTVKADGHASDIKISGGNAPNRVVRLMKEVLYKAMFRPQIVNGAPISTQNFKLVQTFDQ